MGEKADNSAVYRELSADMRTGLKQIYQLICSASMDGETVLQSQALFSEASEQLNEVVKATETATMDIMDIVEKQLDQAETNARVLSRLADKMAEDADLQSLKESNDKLMDSLTNVMTALSFQDITGQRIKKVLGALSGIEARVVDLYLSSGLVMEAAEKNPEADVAAIKQDAQKALDDYRSGREKDENLKGPDQAGQSQAAIDDMLAQLGL